MARPLRILLLSLFSFLLLEACGKAGGFRTRQLNPLVAIQKTAEEKAQENTGVPPAAGAVVRHSGKIKVSQMGNPVDAAGQTTVKADVAVDGHSLGQIEFRGVKKDSKILLEPTDPAYNQKLKATAYCLSDDCDQYFIDVFYKENDVYYQDQFQTANLDEKAEAPTAISTPAGAPPATEQSSAGKGEKGGKGGKTPPVEVKKDPKNDSKTPKQNTPSNNPKAPVVPEPLKPAVEQDLIQDNITAADPSDSQGFVGTSDEEAKALFEKAEAEANPANQATQEPPAKATQQPEKPPVKPQPAQPPVMPPHAPNKPPTPAPAPTPAQVPGAAPAAPKAPTQPKEKAPEEKMPETNKDFPWTVRKDQAIGSSGAGKLRSPTDFMQLSQLPKVFFFIPQPGRTQFFGVLDLAQVLQKMGEYLQTMLPGRRLAITDISKKYGGHLSPHQAHQNGTEADVRYLVRSDESMPADVVVHGRVTSQLLVADQWKLFKKTFELKQVEVIFVDAAIKRAMCEEAKRTQDLKSQSEQQGPIADILKRLYPVAGHDTHFHVKVKCDHELCRRQPYLILPQTGC